MNTGKNIDLGATETATMKHAVGFQGFFWAFKSDKNQMSCDNVRQYLSLKKEQSEEQRGSMFINKCS